MSSSKFDYLRHRPFLVIEMYHRPRAKVKTERKGWANEDTVQTVEQPYLVGRISDSMMRRATVIIDIAFDRVIKNRLRGTGVAFDDEILERCKREHSAMFEAARMRLT